MGERGRVVGAECARFLVDGGMGVSTALDGGADQQPLYEAVSLTATHSHNRKEGRKNGKVKAATSQEVLDSH